MAKPILQVQWYQPLPWNASQGSLDRAAYKRLVPDAGVRRHLYRAFSNMPTDILEPLHLLDAATWTGSDFIFAESVLWPMFVSPLPNLSLPHEPLFFTNLVLSLSCHQFGRAILNDQYVKNICTTDYRATAEQ